MITPTTPVGVVFDELSGTASLSIGDAFYTLTRDQLKDLKLTILRTDRALHEHTHAADMRELVRTTAPTRRSSDYTPLTTS